MKDKKKQFAQMYDLLNREEKDLVSQLSEENDARKRLELSQDLKNVRVILSEISLTQ